jgi:hypothetical protein
MIRQRLLAMAALMLFLGTAAPRADAKDKQEWAEGIPYVTDYDEAIGMAKESGRMLLIYNGWEKPNI